jgi:hypothetical protein
MCPSKTIPVIISQKGGINNYDGIGTEANSEIQLTIYRVSGGVRLSPVSTSNKDAPEKDPGAFPFVVIQL